MWFVVNINVINVESAVNIINNDEILMMYSSEIFALINISSSHLKKIL